MMKMNNYYFIGIKGTGMAALAILLSDLKHNVSGCDLNKHFFTEQPLIDRGIKIDTFENAKIPDNSVVIIGNAFLDDFPLVKEVKNNKKISSYRYHEFLGEFMKSYISLCVSGSHGKTTTTGMLASVMSEFDGGYLIGDGTGYINQNTKYFCVEADEYRRHFLSYNPDYAIITNIDLDHVDYFKDDIDYENAYIEYSNNIKKALFIFGDDKKTRNIKPSCKHYWYGEKDNDDLQAKNVVETSSEVSFDLYFQGKFIYHFKLPFVGKHLLWNALGVIGIGLLEGINPEDIEKGLRNFKGVKRRFVVEEVSNSIFIDDYAHHPTEISVTIDAARKRFPDKKLIAIFKPHRVSRVFKFADEFSSALSKADEVYLCDFTSIDDKEDGIDIDITYLQERIPGSFVIKEDDDAAQKLAKHSPAVFLFMSSKDIYPLAHKVKRYQ